ncbi:MAG: serine acetyltransferase [Bacteroidota bacterium]
MHLGQVNQNLAEILERFIVFLSYKSFLNPDLYFFERDIYVRAFELTVKDVHYFQPEIASEEIFNRITTNQNELPVFLYRFGNLIHQHNPKSQSLKILHGIMRELCACEIYFSNQIDVGFTIIHGVGTVIGSRNIIGKGFKIYQNCTIGHKEIGGKGNIIGDNVTCFAGCSILGENNIGDNAVLGANTLIIKDIAANSIAYGNPLIIKNKSAN